MSKPNESTSKPADTAPRKTAGSAREAAGQEGRGEPVARAPPRTPGHRGGGLRRTGVQRHHGPPDRGRGRHARRQPLLPLRLQGIDARRDPLHLPRPSSGTGYDAVLAAGSAPARPSRPWSPSPSGRSTGTAPPSPSTRRSPAPRRPAPLRLPRRLAAAFEKAWLGTLERGVADGVFRADLDIRLTYRFVRDTVWVAASWYRPGGGPQPRGDRPPVPLDGPGRHRRTHVSGASSGRRRTTEEYAVMAEAYIVEAVRTPVGRRRGGLSRRPPRRPRRPRPEGSWSSAPASTPPPSRTSSSAAWTRSDRRPATSPAPPGWRPGCPRRCPA